MAQAWRATGFRNPYGVYFSVDSPQQYIIFQDNNTNGRYNTGEELLTEELRDSFSVNNVTVDGSSVGELSITYARPNFDARIEGGASEAEIVLVGNNNASLTKSVVIGSGGYIAVE